MSKWNWKCVYAMLANDGKVKIGISKDIKERAKSIENGKEIKILDIFQTDLCSNPYMVERMCHEFFKSKRVFGEWFDIDFNEAVSAINEIFNRSAQFEEVENNWNYKEYFSGTDFNDTEDFIGMLFEIVLHKNKQIDSLLKSVDELSKSNIEMAKMFGEMVFLLNEKFKDI